MARYVECDGCGSRLFDVEGVSLTATGKVASVIGPIRCAMCRKTKPPHPASSAVARGGTRD